MGIKTHNFLLESSGITVTFRNINPLVAVDVRASLEKEKPEPPLEIVTLAGVESLMPNEDDPDYVSAMEDFEILVQQKINETYAKRSKMSFDYPNWAEEVAEYRKELGGEIKESDIWLFLTRVAATANELQTLFGLISATTAPSSTEVEAAKATF